METVQEDAPGVKKMAAIGFGLLIVMMLSLGLVMTARAQAEPFPDLIELPDGFQPVGIVRGRGTTAYVAGFATGAIYQIDLETGQGSMLVPGQEGRMALGLEFDRRTGYLYAGGGPTGQLYVYDTATGGNVGEFQLTTESETVINKIILVGNVVYVTDSLRPVYFRIPLRPGGRLPNADAIEEIPLSGDFQFVPGALNGNGLEATPNGKLIMSHTNLGKLYLVDARSGHATEIAIGVGCGPIGADGSTVVILDGRTLYVVNFYNQVIKIKLNPGFQSGIIEDSLTSLLTDPWPNPEGGILYGNSIYYTASKFSQVVGPDTEFRVVKLPIN